MLTKSYITASHCSQIVLKQTLHIYIYKHWSFSNFALIHSKGPINKIWVALTIVGKAHNREGMFKVNPFISQVIVSYVMAPCCPMDGWRPAWWVNSSLCFTCALCFYFPYQTVFISIHKFSHCYSSTSLPHPTRTQCVNRGSELLPEVKTGQALN